MAQNPFKTPAFQALFKEWNQILEQGGLKEVEDFNLPEPALKTWHNLKWKGIEPSRIPEIQKYYELASELLTTFDFKTPVHKRIWELHCQGLSVRKIERALRKKRFTKTTIHRVIMQIETQSGIRT